MRVQDFNEGNKDIDYNATMPIHYTTLSILESLDQCLSHKVGNILDSLAPQDDQGSEEKPSFKAK